MLFARIAKTNISAPLSLGGSTTQKKKNEKQVEKPYSCSFPGAAEELPVERKEDTHRRRSQDRELGRLAKAEAKREASKGRCRSEVLRANQLRAASRQIYCPPQDPHRWAEVNPPAPSLTRCGDVEENPGPDVRPYVYEDEVDRTGFDGRLRQAVAMQNAYHVVYRRAMCLLLGIAVVSAAAATYICAVKRGTVWAVAAGTLIGTAIRALDGSWKIWGLLRAGLEVNPGPLNRRQREAARGAPAGPPCRGRELTPLESMPFDKGGVIVLEPGSGTSIVQICKLCGDRLTLQANGRVFHAVPRVHPSRLAATDSVVSSGLVPDPQTLSQSYPSTVFTPASTAPMQIPVVAQSAASPPPVSPSPMRLAPSTPASVSSGSASMPVDAAAVSVALAGYKGRLAPSDPVADFDALITREINDQQEKEARPERMRAFKFELDALTTQAAWSIRYKKIPAELSAEIRAHHRLRSADPYRAAAKAVAAARSRPRLDGVHLSEQQADAVARILQGKISKIQRLAGLVLGTLPPLAALGLRPLPAPVSRVEYELQPYGADSRLVTDRNVVETKSDLVVAHVHATWREVDFAACAKRLLARPALLAAAIALPAVLTASPRLATIALATYAAADLARGYFGTQDPLVKSRAAQGSYIPHAASCVLQEYRNGEPVANVSSTVDAKLLRLATLPVHDADALALHRGTAQVVEIIAAEAQGFHESRLPLKPARLYL